MRLTPIPELMAAILLGFGCSSSATSPKPPLDSVPKYTILPGYSDDFGDTTLVEGIFRPMGTLTVRDASSYQPGGGVTAPVSPPSSPSFIAEAAYPAGFSAGSAPGFIYSTGLPEWTHLYMAITVQLSSNWYGQSSSENKVIVGFIHGNPCLIVSATGRGSGTMTWTFHLQNLGLGASDINLTANVGDATVTRGLWQRVEIEVIGNTPGVYDGVARMWITDYDNRGQVVSGPGKVAEYTNIGWSSRSQSNTWEVVKWDPIWGGIGGTVPERQYMWLDRLAIGGR